MTDPEYGVTYGFVLPPTNATGSTATEFIGEILAPVSNEWVRITSS